MRSLANSLPPSLPASLPPYRRPCRCLCAQYADYPVHALSGGNRKKLLVEGACQGPSDGRLLLVDECTSGVDPVAARRLVAFLQGAGGGMLFSSHHVDACSALCARTVLLLDGRVAYDGPAAGFDRLRLLFYQADLLLAEGGAAEGVERTLRSELGGAVDRVVRYGDSMLRVTLERERAPYSRALRAFGELRSSGRLRDYLLRPLDAEEALAAVLDRGTGAAE